MRKQSGFTLIELMVVVAILGILAVTAVPFYQTWAQRAYGTQASVMMKSIMDGQIIYNLEKNEFFPPVGERIFIPYEGQGSPDPTSAVEDIEKALKVKVSQSRHFRYTIENYGPEGVAVTIESPFALFSGQPKDGGWLIASLTKDGQVIYVGP